MRGYNLTDTRESTESTDFSRARAYERFAFTYALAWKISVLSVLWLHTVDSYPRIYPRISVLSLLLFISMIIKEIKGIYYTFSDSFLLAFKKSLLTKSAGFLWYFYVFKDTAKTLDIPRFTDFLKRIDHKSAGFLWYFYIFKDTVKSLDIPRFTDFLKRIDHKSSKFLVILNSYSKSKKV